jgi:dTMP kinase
VTFVLSAVLIGRIAERLLQSRKAESTGYWRDLRAGLGLVRSPALLAVVCGWGLAAFAVGTTDVAEVELAKRAFDAGNFGLGVLMAASGFGLIVGSLLAAEATTRFGTAGAYGVSITLMALGLVLAALSPNVWIAAVVVVAVGLGNGVAVVINSLLVQRGTEDEVRGRAFTLAMSANYSAVLLGMIAGGFVADAVGARWTWGVGGVVLGCAAVIAYAYARAAGEAPAPGVEPAAAAAAAGAAAAGAAACHE